MNNSFSIFAMAATALLFASCATETTIITPGQDVTNIRSSNTVSSEEMRQCTLEATRKIMGHPRFNSFLQQYKVEQNDANAIPVLKLTQTVNDTNDPNLNTAELTDMLNEALMDSGKVEITLAEGSDRTQSIADSRANALDPNFDQKTVAKQGTLQAARLVLRPKVISNNVKDGRTEVVTRTFVIDIADINRGTVIFRVTQQLGFMKKAPVFGW